MTSFDIGYNSGYEKCLKEQKKKVVKLKKRIEEQIELYGSRLNHHLLYFKKSKDQDCLLFALELKWQIDELENVLKIIEEDLK